MFKKFFRQIIFTVFILPTFCKTSLASTWEFAAEALYLQPDIDILNFRGGIPSDGKAYYVNYNPNYAW